MLRRLKVEVMAQLPPKRRQVVRLPAPKQADWPPSEIPIQHAEGRRISAGVCPRHNPQEGRCALGSLNSRQMTDADRF